MKTCCAACPILEEDQAFALGQVTFEAVERISLKTQTATAFARDMVCVFAFSDRLVPEPLSELDATLGGALAEKLRRVGFNADVGQQLVINVYELSGERADLPHFIMLLGLGSGLPAPELMSAHQAIQHMLCASGGAFAQAAAALEISELTLDFSGLASHNINLVGMSALLRCRLAIEMERLNLGIDRVQVLCDKSELSAVRLGLAQDYQLCPHCTRPTFPGQEQSR